MNNVTLIGRLTKDPEITRSKNNTSIAHYTLAVDSGYDTFFIPCVCFDRKAEFAKKFLFKGIKIAVTGSISMSDYTDKNGNKRTSFSVVVNTHEFCEARRGDVDGND